MNDRRGQSTAEYAVLIAVAVGALLAMQIYVKRGAMGRLKDATDQIGEQFSPLHTTSEFKTNYHSKRTETVDFDGSSNSVLAEDERQQRGTKAGGKGEILIEKKLDEETLY